MRNLFFALILANLGFAAWAAWYAEPRTSGELVTNPSIPQITLVSELAETDLESIEEVSEAAPEPTPPPVPVADTADAQTCISVGPFEELAQASAAQATLRDAGFAPTQRVVDGDVWVGYWVHLPGIATRGEANEILGQLHANDISDSYIVPGGEESQTISLGVFSEIGRAGSVREQVRELGYDPAVADRSRSATLYWIDVLASSETEIELDALQAPGRINRLEQRRCETIG